ncbi:hypothetical protein GCM10022396_30520 [Flavivirga amylovorans]
MSCDEDEEIISLNQISLNESNVQLGLGQVQTLVVTPTPKDATHPKVTWSSSNEDVAQIQINESGLVAGVKGIGTGEAVITAKMENGDVGQTVNITVQRMYCDVSGTGSYYVESVTTTGGNSNINHNGLQPEDNYAFYSEEILDISSGSSFTLEVVQSNNWSRTMVWIDWNGDGNFSSDDELAHVFGVGSDLNDGPFNASIEVPANAAKGAVRMRIVTGDAWSYDEVPIAVCDKLKNSSTKDFIIEIL